MPATDDYQSHAMTLESPICAAQTVTPSDSADLAAVSRAIYIGGEGDVRLDLRDGVTVTFRTMAVGWHPVRATRIRATGTTATNIVACW